MADRRNPVGRYAAATGMLLDDVGARSPINAVNLVVSDVAVQPLNLRSKIAKDAQRIPGGFLSLLRGHLAHAGYFALNDELGHVVMITEGDSRLIKPKYRID